MLRSPQIQKTITRVVFQFADRPLRKLRWVLLSFVLNDKPFFYSFFLLLFSGKLHKRWIPPSVPGRQTDQTAPARVHDTNTALDVRSVVQSTYTTTMRFRNERSAGRQRLSYAHSPPFFGHSNRAFRGRQLLPTDMLGEILDFSIEFYPKTKTIILQRRLERRTNALRLENTNDEGGGPNRKSVLTVYSSRFWRSVKIYKTSCMVYAVDTNGVQTKIA